MNNFDVVIVGAGPSGSICAYYLAKHGYKVLLVDKNKFPRQKTCGGGISLHTLKELPFTLPSNIIEERIYGVKLIAPPSINIMYKKDKLLGITVDRQEFDNFILRKAIDEGVVFIENCKIKNYSYTDNKIIVNGKFRSSMLIGADGANSMIAKAINQKHKQVKSIAARVLYSIPSNHYESKLTDRELFEFYFYSKVFGYGWCFPLKNFLNIGFGMVGNLQNFRYHMKKSLALILKSKGLNYKHLDIAGHPLLLGQKDYKKISKKVLLIGEAAGLVDPVSGEGIIYAVRSAKIAAHSIITSSKNGSFINAEKKYDHLLKKDITNNLTYAHLIRKIMALTFVNNMENTFKYLRSRPETFNIFWDMSNTSNYYKIIKNTINPF